MLKLRAVTCSLLLAIAVPLPAFWHSPASYVFYACMPGHKTLDQGEGGGNPFASALVELLQKPSLTVATLAEGLSTITREKSRSYQDADIPNIRKDARRSILPGKENKRKVALVLGISEYRGHGLASLPGVAYDAGRIVSSLEAAGFQARKVLDPDEAELERSLTSFAAQSEAADVALIYVSGHGVEIRGETDLLLVDFVPAEGEAGLSRHSVSLATIAQAAHSRQLNLVLYGGCRNNPFLRSGTALPLD